MIPVIKDLVGNDQMVRFHHYEWNELWYEHYTGFLFPVPISDTGDATFLNEDRAILFMRWMRKYIKELLGNDSQISQVT